MYFNECNYRAILPTYKTATKYQQYKVNTDKYEIVKFSRDINEKFRHMEEHFEELKELLKYNIEPYSIVGLLASQIRILYQVKSLEDQGMRNTEIANTLNKKPFYIQKTSELTRFYTKKELLELMMKLEKYLRK